MKFKHLLIPFAIAVMLPLHAQAFPDGRGQGDTSSCGGCHGGTSSSAVTVTITGPTTLLPGATATYTTALTGNFLAGAGFNVNLTGPLAGATLGLLDANTQFVAASGGAPAPYGTASQITHLNGWTATPAGNLGDWSYDFKLTAPTAEGNLALRSVMLAYDNDFSSSGDLWNFSTFNVAVAAAVPAVPESPQMFLLVAGLGTLAFVRRRRSGRMS
jgi:MYXO-CTERM domain-containing protein